MPDITHDLLLERRNNCLIVGENNTEIIVSHIAGDPFVLLLCLFQMEADVYEKLVTRLLSVPFIEKLEMFYVNDHETVLMCS